MIPSETDILLDRLAHEKPGIIADCARKYIGTGIEGHQYLVEIYWQMTQSKNAGSSTFSEKLISDFHTYFKRDLKTESKFTPGPWTRHETAVLSERVVVCSCHEYSHKGSITHDECVANAKLIKESPSLYGFLLDTIDETVNRDWLKERAKELIKRINE